MQGEGRVAGWTVLTLTDTMLDLGIARERGPWASPGLCASLPPKANRSAGGWWRHTRVQMIS